MNGTILQDPVNMGYLGVKTAVAKLKGEKVEAVIDTGATLVSSANMDDPKVAALIKSQLP
jgi:ribose transport system substrate-binding protein